MWEVIFWITAIAVLLGGLAFCWMIGNDFPFVGIIGAIAWIGFWLFAAFGIADEAFGNHPTFTLRKDRWACTARHTEVQTTYISNAKGGLTPMVTSNVVCDQYTRIG